MTSDVETPSAAEFFSLAEELEYATHESLAPLVEECRQTSVAPEVLALRKGLLDPVEIEIIGTLLRPIETIPGYKILKVLGRGGMGVVYEAEQANLGRTVALKTILVGRMGSPSAISRFELEARTVAQLRHPNIVVGYDFGRNDGRVFFAMELVKGEELADRLKRDGTLDERVAWGVARQTAAGLAHAANQGVVHRDIKPCNLLLVRPPEGIPFPADMPMVKIADFGLASLTNSSESSTRLTSDNTTVGSPHYMAPEQFQQSNVDLRADIYSLGATVYAMLSGQAPFSCLNLTQIMASKLAGGLMPLKELRPGLSPGTYELLEWMMAQSADGRPASYPELIALIDDLCPGLFGETTTATVAEETVVLSTSKLTTPPDRADTAVLASKTDVMPATSGFTGNKNWRHLVIGMVGLLPLFFGVWWFSRPAENGSTGRPTRIRMEDLGPSLRLFNGSNIAGWQQRKGNWIVPPKTATLEGTDGLLVRPLFKKFNDQPEPIGFFRLIVFMERAEAESAEIQFGFVVDDQRNGARYVLRLADEGFQVGERVADDADFTPFGNSPPSPVVGETAAIIEQQPDGWFIMINERPLAALPRRSGGELPEIRLATIGGPARFSDITITELAPAGTKGK